MEEIEGYAHSEDWKNRCLARHLLKSYTDQEISNWLIELKKNHSSQYVEKIRKILHEEWLFIAKAIKKKKSQKLEK